MNIVNTSALAKPVPAVVETYSVVIADDDRNIADLLAMNLRRLGHRVIGVARNGREAVEMAVKTRPDLVMLDIQMPILDGLQAAREILNHRLTPIVMSTAQTDSKSISGAIDLKVLSYLVKPFSPAQLNVAIQLAVAQCRGLANQDVLPAGDAHGVMPKV